MDALPREGRGDGAGRDSPNGILEAYARIRSACFVAGLAPFDAEDVAQDVFLWLLRNGPLLAMPAMPWLVAVVKNFIHRHHRKSSHRRHIEGISLNVTAEPPAREVDDTFERQEMLDRVAAVLPETERRLLALIRSGRTIAEAARMLKIPRGSRIFYKGHLVACARRGLRPRETPAPISPLMAPPSPPAPRTRATSHGAGTGAPLRRPPEFTGPSALQN